MNLNFAMELFVCKTCIYSSSNKLSFKKVERVKCILELLVPETRTSITTDTLICCQCYYFLKNVENFRIKCADIQNQKAMRNFMIDYNIYEMSNQLMNPLGTNTLQSTQSSNADTLKKETGPLFMQYENPSYNIHTDKHNYISKKSNETVINLDGVRKHFDHVQTMNLHCEKNMTIGENPIYISDDDSVKCLPTTSMESYESDVDDIFEEKDVILIKPEPILIEEENPSFFNKMSPDGYYNCKLCEKKYRNSSGLYNHTQQEHEELKFFHCDACNFFSLWKSALLRHETAFHSLNSVDDIDNSYLYCHNCSFKTMCKQSIENHVQTHFSTNNLFRCSHCNKNWVKKDLFENHLDAHRRGQILTCFICKNPYSKYYLKRHLVEIHGVTTTCSLYRNY